MIAKNFTKLKTKTSKNKRSNIVYEIPCSGCNGVYIGQTSQYLENRIKSHKYDKKNSTALTAHERKTQHSFNFESAKILKTETNTRKRELYESIEIQKNYRAINDKKDANNISRIYSSLFQ